VNHADAAAGRIDASGLRARSERRTVAQEVIEEVAADGELEIHGTSSIARATHGVGSRLAGGRAPEVLLATSAVVCSVRLPRDV
jgi:hypothetical protein